MGSDFLFTYGTLMQDFDNPFAQKLRAGSLYTGNGSFYGLLYQISWYPGAVYKAGGPEKVYGEIYELPEQKQLLQELDDYEDVATDESLSLYVRKIIPVMTPNDTLLPCWVYLYNQSVSSLRQITSGNFKLS